MLRLVVLPMYDINDICLELAKRRGRTNSPYTRQAVNFWIKHKLPMAEKIAGQYFLTEAQVCWLAAQLGTPKRQKA